MEVSINKKSNINSANDILGAKYFHWTELDSRYLFTQYLGQNYRLNSYTAQGKHINTGKKVTLKKVFQICEKTDAKRLLQQIKILKALRGLDNIVELFDILPPKNFETFTQIILTFEFVDTDLSQLIRSNQYLSLLQIQYILYQILLGLKCMHSLNFTHHNLQPSNILVDQYCTVKICDFDLVCFKCDKANMTNRLNVCYVAPEIILQQKNEYGLYCIDMWSVGCIFAELLQMLRDNVPSYKNRKPLFTPSYYDMISNNINIHPLKNIFDIIGTPTPDDMLNINDNRVAKLLMQIPKCLPIDFTNMYPTNNEITLRLLQGFLQFDVEKRMSVHEALSHPFIQHVKNNQNEMKCVEIINKIKESDLLEFECDKKKNMTINMYRSLIIEEVCKYSRNFCQLIVPGYINKYYLLSLVPYDIMMLINKYYIIDEI
eukprot:40733_1